LNRRERLRRCYFHEEMDRPGVYSRTGFPEDDPTYDRLKAYLAAHSELKRGWHPPIIREPTVRAEVHTEPISADFEREITVLHTPAGEFRASRFLSLRGQPELPETHFIKDRRDAERWLSLPKPEVGGDVSSFFELDRRMGDAGIVDVGLGTNPAGYLNGMLGSETLAFMSITDRDVVHELCQRRMETLQEAIKYLLARGVGPFFGLSGHELVAPPIHGPKDFWDFNVKYDRPLNDLIHDGGGRVHVHCHGRLALVFQGFLEMGVDVLHPVEPPPMGDLTAAQAKALAGDRLTIEGNIQIAHMYEHTPAEVRAETEALIRDAFADHRGLIVSPTASPYIRGAGEECFPMYRAMIDAVLAQAS